MAATGLQDSSTRHTPAPRVNITAPLWRFCLNYQEPATAVPAPATAIVLSSRSHKLE